MNGLYEIGDSCHGTVIGRMSSGLKIRLDNGEAAYTLFGYVPTGTRVLCRISRYADEIRDMFVRIDSVMEEIA